MPKDTNKDNKVISSEITEATQQAMAEEAIPADGTGSEEYEAAVRDFLANKDKLMEEVQLLREQSEEMLTDIPSNEEDDADDTSDDMTDVTDDVPDADDSGHIADVISEDGEAVSGAVIWSSSGRKFIVMSADGSPVSDLEAEQAMELIDSKRIAFDNADDHERFVSKMSAMGVDVDQDKVDVSQDGSTGELLVDPEELIGNERHHMSGEHAGKNVAWDDEVDLNDPESTGPQRIEQILRGQGTAGATETAQGKISGLKVYRADNIMTFVSVLLIVTFYILVIVFQQPSPFMLGVWSTLCVAATTAVMMPFTMSMETREKMIGGKFLLTGSLCIVFFVMSLLLLIDAAIANRSQWQPGVDVPQQVTGSETADEPPVMLDFEPSGDVVVLEMTGTPRSYPAVAIGNVLVTTGEASQANSLTANLDGKHYVAQTVATIDGLGISAFAVESAGPFKSVSVARSLSIGQDVIVYFVGEDGTARVEGATIKSTTFPVGTHGLPESSEIDQVFVDKNLEAGTLVMDLDGKLVGIAPEAGDGVVTGTSISKAVNVLTSNDNDIYLGIVCRQASISENEDGGAYVENVLTNSPASNAGIMTGDIIVSVDGTTIDGTDDLDEAVGEHEAGEQVDLGILRGGKDINLSVTIGRHGKDITLSPKTEIPLEPKQTDEQTDEQTDKAEAADAKDGAETGAEAVTNPVSS